MGHQSEDPMFDISIYADANDQPSVLVPIVRATPENLVGFGNLVTDYESENVIRATWPKAGWRQIAPGTGNHQVRVTSYHYVDNMPMMSRFRVGATFLTHTVI